MLRKLLALSLFALFGGLVDAAAQPLPDPTRGELLYSTHCIACHDKDIHWRNKKLVNDWRTLRSEIRRWQGAGKLGWVSEDVEQVARYLNSLYYHLAPD